MATPRFKFAILILVLVMGLAAGLALKFVSKAIQSAEHSPGQTVQIPPSFASPVNQVRSLVPLHETPPGPVYAISAPSIGVAVETIPVKTQFSFGKARVTVGKELAPRFEKGQVVLFKNGQGDVLPALARIDDLLPLPDSEGLELVIDLYFNEDVDLDTLTNGEIIVKRVHNAARLPLSAIIKDHAGQSAVWEVLPQSGTLFTAQIKPVEVVSQQQDAAVIRFLSAPVSNRYILEPDPNLKEKMIIKGTEIFYRGPAFAPDIQLQKEMREKNLAVMQDMAEDLRYRVRGGASLPPSPTPALPVSTEPDVLSELEESLSCNARDQDIMRFIESVRSLGQDQSSDPNRPVLQSLPEPSDDAN